MVNKTTKDVTKASLISLGVILSFFGGATLSDNNIFYCNPWNKNLTKEKEK